MTRAAARALLDGWFESQGWTPARFQREVWRRYLAGESGLLHTPTGSGKTLAAVGGPMLEGLAEAAQAAPEKRVIKGKPAMPRLRVLWITPLRALAADTVRSLRMPIEALGLHWDVVMRTGDASARDRRLAQAGQAEVLVTTPESLALLLSYPTTPPLLAGLRCVVVDEWHELLGNKRGVLLQLCLARLRRLAPTHRTWGLSATLGNLDEARDVLLRDSHAAIVQGAAPRGFQLRTLLPPAAERFPWAGHLGLVQLPRVVETLAAARTSLLFTNTRSQAELWHKALSSVWMEDSSTLALHHGSLDPKLRTEAEQGLRDGSLRCVVATSSLDLGVDFPAVDQVLQLGSPKGIARLLQRAGRARHRPGESGSVVCVPTHVLELFEYAAAREAVGRGAIEARAPPRMSLDVLAQHCVTLALGGGFLADELLAEVRSTHAFAALDEPSWQAVLDFIVQGGAALSSYPEYCRVVHDTDGAYRVHDRRIALRHRLSIGTITSDGSVAVQFLKGGRLGSVEEGFIGRLQPGSRFQFAGKTLELVKLHDMTAYVRLSKRNDGIVPKWQGGRMPLSSELGREVERLFASNSLYPERAALEPLIALQRKLSALPGPDQLLVETVRTRDGQHLFLYAFAGRAVHQGVAVLLAYRLSQITPNSFAFAANDYGLVLSSAKAVSLSVEVLQQLLSPVSLEADLHASLNLGELARRQFRDVARIAGLLPPSLPGRAPRSMRQLQASSSLLFDVLRQHDPGHILLALAEREVLSHELDLARITSVLADCLRREPLMHEPKFLTPLSFPLWAESVRGHLSSEAWKVRVDRAAASLEKRFGRT